MPSGVALCQVTFHSVPHGTLDVKPFGIISPFQTESYSGAYGRSAQVLCAADYRGDNQPTYNGNPNLQPYLLKIRRANWEPRCDYVVQDLRQNQIDDVTKTPATNGRAPRATPKEVRGKPYPGQGPGMCKGSGHD